MSKIGISTASKPSALIWSRIASCCSVTCVVHRSRFMPVFMIGSPIGDSLAEEIVTVKEGDEIESRAGPR